MVVVYVDNEGYKTALCEDCAAKADENREAVTYLYSAPDEVCERCGKIENT